jgi:hypothetical protein
MSVLFRSARVYGMSSHELYVRFLPAVIFVAALALLVVAAVTGLGDYFTDSPVAELDSTHPSTCCGKPV